MMNSPWSNKESEDSTLDQGLCSDYDSNCILISEQLQILAKQPLSTSS